MKGLAVTSMVLGIVAAALVAFSCGLLYLPCFILALVGVILGGISLSQYSKAENKEGRGMAVAGLVLCIAVLAMAVIVWLACFACVAGGLGTGSTLLGH